MTLSYCLVGAIIIGSMFMIMISKGKVDQKFRDSLNPAQKAVYAEIYKERLTIFIQGLVIGAALAAGYGLIFSSGTMMNACLIASIVLGTAYLYYTIRHKKMIVNYLETPEQVALYTELYREYQTRSATGMILGVVGIFILSLGIFN